MIPAVLIAKKRDGGELTTGEITDFIIGYSTGKIADYQMSAMAMAICLQGMTPEEVSALTQSMLDSGDRLRRDFGRGLVRVDKHSTGGLGDKVSIALAPLLACSGVDVPMISGRGLGLSGGTLDKLEAIDHFDVNQSMDSAGAILTKVGCHIISASERIAPADRKLYGLRDVTGTVESVPLITASILSKKLAASLDALVMDVKVGNGAFMKTREQAQRLAKSLVDTGEKMGLPVTALITDMDQPLGNAIGNSNETQEAIDLLKGEGPEDLRTLTLELCGECLLSAGVCSTLDEARALLARKISDGSAYAKFEEMVVAHGGNLNKELPKANELPVISKLSGVIASIDCEAIGRCIVALGGGRKQKTDKIDPRVGVNLDVKVGQEVQRGQRIGTLLSNSADSDSWVSVLQESISISAQQTAAHQLIIERIGQANG